MEKLLAVDSRGQADLSFRLGYFTIRLPSVLPVLVHELILNKWQIASMDKCPCGQPQMMNSIVELCPLLMLLILVFYNYIMLIIMQSPGYVAMKALSE